jgi:hypothetical protein
VKAGDQNATTLIYTHLAAGATYGGNTSYALAGITGGTADIGVRSS